MATKTHPIAVAVHLQDAFNRRDVDSILGLLHRTVEISQSDGSTALGHRGARRLLEEADAMGTARYVRWAHYVCKDGVVSGALKLELCEKSSGDQLAQTDAVVTLDCEKGKVRAIAVGELNREESEHTPEDREESEHTPEDREESERTPEAAPS